MVRGKDSSDAKVSQHQASPPTNNPSTMSSSAKPKSSTSEAANTQKNKKRGTITRCSESDEEGIEDLISEPVKPNATPSETAKPRASTTKKQVTPELVDSDHEDEEDSEDDDEDEESSDNEPPKAAVKAPVKATPLANKKQTSSKKQAPKRPIDSDNDDDVVEVASKSKKSKIQPAPSSTSKKQTASLSKRKSNDDSDDEIIEMPSKTTKTKPRANSKHSVKPSSSVLTKKQTFKALKAPPAETDSDSEEDSSDEEAPNITISERKGDLFAAPPNTLLLHACNCVGSWGAGIALSFKKHYPDHFAIYKAHCDAKTPNSILSTCLLIPPQATGPKHWIGCLFTSRKYGRGKDSKDDIVDSTDSALQDMLEQLEALEDKPERIWMCKINSGSFKVPWSQTKALIEALTFKDGLHIFVVDKK